ncbi:MAG: heavy-metal-associated domain-containing protein [Candidatus Thiodiazotropha sp.]
MKARESLKPSGPWEVRRRIRLPSLSHQADALAVEGVISALPGVVTAVADVEKQRLDIRYDASRLNYLRIVEALEQTGFPALVSWWSRMKSNWYRFTDETARENANVPPSACCNKPPR